MNRIELEAREILSGSGDSIDLAAALPGRSSAGYFAVRLLSPPSGGVALFDPDGQFLQDLVRPGDGPGEVRDVMSVGFGPGDTLWILDQYVRLHAFSPPPHSTLVRTVRLPEPLVARVTAHGLLVDPLLRTNVVVPPALVDWEGTTIARFGTGGSQENANRLLGSVYLRDSVSVWVAAGDAYVVDEVIADGSSTRRISRNIEWFPPGLVTQGLPSKVPPRPRIEDITEDESGLVWLLIRRAHSEWSAAADVPSTSPGPIPLSVARSVGGLSKYYETVLEVIDPATGVLVATRTLGGGMIGFVAPGVLCEVQESDQGIVTLRLHSVALHREDDLRARP